MGRPLNKHLFGANALNNIKVQFHNGVESVPGYIVRQRSNLKFLCEDANGVQAVCKLVNKTYSNLEAGEMSITVKYDDNTVRQVVKIAKNLITVNLQENDVAPYEEPLYWKQAGWTFNTSNSDQKWQIEEAGSDAAMTSKTDLEGDETYNAALDYPVPGSGAYQSAADALDGITYANIGTPWVVGGGLSSVPNSHAGLRRTKYDGNFCATATTLHGSWNFNWFTTATAIKSIADTHVSWGQQSDGSGTGEHNFSCEWVGYVQAPKSGNFNIWGESDDHIGMWIGTAATAAPANNVLIFGANNKTLPAVADPGVNVNANTVTLTAGQWYPVRIWHGEFSGGCKAQVYFQAADGTVYNGEDLTWAYNNSTGGF